MTSSNFASPVIPSVLSVEVTMTLERILSLSMPYDKTLWVDGQARVTQEKVKGDWYWVAIQPACDGYGRLRRYSKVDGGSADAARKQLREALVHRYHVHSEVKITVQDRNALVRMLRGQAESTIPLLKAWELGDRMLKGQKDAGYDIDAYAVVMEEGRKSKITLGQACKEFLDSIPEPRRDPLCRQNNQRTVITPIIAALLEEFGSNTPLTQVIRDTKKLELFLRRKIKQETK